jgi:hypothetical protein
MSDLLSLISSSLSGGTVRQIADQIGASPEQTSSAMETALPLLVGALSRNAQQPGGAQALTSALERDHDGGLLGQLGGLGGAAGALGGLLGGGRSGGGGLMGGAGSAILGQILGSGGGKALDGSGILGHILGGKKGAVEQGVGKASGLDAANVGQLLTILAPIVMSALAKYKQQQGLDAGGIASALEREQHQLEQQTPGMQQGGLAQLLDRDGDGSIADDIAGIGSALGGSGLLGSLLGGRR